MKCGYGTNCKHDGDVSKEEAIKVGTRYYHKDCLKEKELKVEVEQYWNDNFPQCNVSVLRKAIKTLITKGNDIEYVLMVMKWVKVNKKPLNYPMGISSYCNNAELRKEWEKKKINEEYSKFKNETIQTKNETVKFDYKPNRYKFTNII